MPTPPPITINPSANATPNEFQPGSAYCAAQHTVNAPETVYIDVTTWHEESALQSLFGRMIAGVGLAFLVRYGGTPSAEWLSLYGPKTLSDMAFDSCNVQIKLGDTIKSEFPASLFRDTKKIQRILEIPIRPPLPSNNDGLTFRIYSLVPMPEPEVTGLYRITAIIQTSFPPIPNARPAQWLPPRGIGLVSFR